MADSAVAESVVVDFEPLLTQLPLFPLLIDPLSQLEWLRNRFPRPPLACSILIEFVASSLSFCDTPFGTPKLMPTPE
jgi:hypothetical protein